MLQLHENITVTEDDMDEERSTHGRKHKSKQIFGRKILKKRPLGRELIPWSKALLKKLIFTTLRNSPPFMKPKAPALFSRGHHWSLP
jgi:hypothetical protein